MYDNVSAIDYIEQQFPHLSEGLHDESYEGLLHCQMGLVFASWAQTLIDGCDTNTWDQVFNVFLELWDNGTNEVKNALNVSFLEHLNFHDSKRKHSRINRSWALDAMHPRMRQAWKEMERYNRRLHD